MQFSYFLTTILDIINKINLSTQQTDCNIWMKTENLFSAWTDFCFQIRFWL